MALIHNDDDLIDGSIKQPQQQQLQQPHSTRQIEYRVQAMKKTMGLFDHYYLVIGDKEYHPGRYKPGKVLPVNTTKGYHIVSTVSVCDECYNKIVVDLHLEEDIRMFSYFPFMNCETMCFGISIQSLAIYLVPFLVVLLWRGQLFYAIMLVLISLTVLLVRSKYIFSRTVKSHCAHILPTTVTTAAK